MRRNKTLEDLIAEYGAGFWTGPTWPTGITAQILTDLITERCGKLYSFLQDPAQLHAQIIAWAADHKANWERIYLALSEEYNPIYNYFREELGSEEIAKHKGSKISSNEDVSETPATITQTGSVVAYDSSEESETGQSVTSPGATSSHRTAQAASNYTTYEDVSANVYDKDVHSFTNRITQGNIGVTQSVDMIEAEKRLRMGETLTEIIAQAFEDRFMIQVY